MILDCLLALVGCDAAHSDAPVLQKSFQSQDLAAIVRRLRMP
jgi:hypothetical protein